MEELGIFGVVMAIALVIYSIWLFFFPAIVIGKMNEIIRLLKGGKDVGKN